MTVEEIIQSATLIELKPGDVLVVLVPDRINADQAAALKERIAVYTSRTVMVMGNGMTFGVLREVA